MQYGDNRPKYIRWIIYAVLIVLAVLLQNSAGGLTEISGARILIVIPLCVSVAMFERETTAALFGAFAGVLCDVSGGTDGLNAFILAVLCAVCSLFVSRIMRNNVLSALVLGSATVAVYEIVCIAVGVFVAGNPIRRIFAFYIPSFLLTVLLIPLCYVITRKIYFRHRTVEE